MAGSRIPVSQEANYRRGTVMGLTAAETFMLICFILLLLLSYWIATTRNATEFYRQFSDEQRLAAQEYRADLARLDETLARNLQFERLLDDAGGKETLLDALRLVQERPDLSVEDLSERLRLLDDDIVRQIAEQSLRLETEERLALRDLSTVKDLPAMVSQVASLPEDVQEMMVELQQFRESGVDPKQISAMSEALAAYRATGMDPGDVLAMTDELSDFRRSGLAAEEVGDLAEAVADLRSSNLATGREIADEIRRRAGDVIASMGGQVLDNGNVVFPDGVLFDQGSAEIKPAFRKVLENICEPWVSALHAFDGSIRNIQIEGHASSDWGSLVPIEAFRNNLDLSQRRSANVFNECLDDISDPELYGWARDQLAAVGYSSSRLIRLADGSEDRERSRRVVFGIDLKTREDLAIDRLFAESE
ncbi:MAG: OmpA family protein [Oceanospirillaceae bacterium]|uniref:OmpA family protein n=1 Tax=Salipiger sp. HF18 TaxID=2721557 RepID=UPI00142D27A1|nr:OmpA family protein [Salipiger sp. HF18]NIY97332.1 OmpA family protein [Salipiger sp. HF18]NVK39793.1 OmpA family protein [Oceanospirillaceae bacterium]